MVMIKKELLLPVLGGISGAIGVTVGVAVGTVGVVGVGLAEKVTVPHSAGGIPLADARPTVCPLRRAIRPPGGP